MAPARNIYLPFLVVTIVMSHSGWDMKLGMEINYKHTY